MLSTTSAVFGIFLVLNLLSSAILAAPLDAAFHHGCPEILERKEWYVVDISILTLIYSVLLRRALTDEEKKSYTDAVRCLQTQPARNTSQPASWTRFDEFQAHHIQIATQVHYVVSTTYFSSFRGVFSSMRQGEFLPWHRQYVKVYETALREDCGYDGAQP
jgi:tyrosinase